MWYFSNEARRLRYEDGRLIAVGLTHKVDCQPVLCKRGLHASPTVLKALGYAPGPILWRVTLSGIIENGDDKSCATERTYHETIDATPILRAFARKCALSVIHLWDAPRVVRSYLETGDETLRDAAGDAARAAARAAARDAAGDAAGDAARAAGWAAARDAARDAAWAAGWAAAWAAARDAARDAQEKMLDEMVLEALKGGV